MTVESATYPSQFNTNWPEASDMVSEGDDHIRLVKTVVKTTFPNVAGVVSATHTSLNYVTGATSNIQTQIDAKGAIAGQTWSGTHAFPSSTTIGNLTPTIRGYLETITSDAQAQINAKGAITGQAWTGAHSFAGSITVPTATAGDSSTNAASTAFVTGTAFASALPGQSGNAGKFVTTDGSSAAWAFPYLKRVAVAGTTQAATSGDRYELQNAALTTVTLPLAPSDGMVVAVLAVNLRVDNVIARNGQSICGVADDLTIDNPYYPVVLEFRTGYGWGLTA